MAKKSEPTKDSAKRNKKSPNRSEEGEYGQRLNETRIDAEVASKNMEGSRSVPEDEAREAFESDGQQDKKERDLEE